MAYRTAGGRILTFSLEAHVVDHCNLRCAHCCTRSPLLPPRVTSVAALRRDLDLAAAALAPDVFKLTGGEPFLHPDLAGCLDAVRASGIAREVSLTTNGLLVRGASDAVFERLDRLTVSWYTSAPLPEATIDHIRERCDRHGVRLNLKEIDRFQVLDCSPHADPATTRDLFGGCWLRVRCHLVHGGRFYTCTRPPHLGPPAGEGDGVLLDAPALATRLLAYLESGEPLGACRICLGGTGAWEPHRQNARWEAITSGEADRRL